MHVAWSPVFVYRHFLQGPCRHDTLLVDHERDLEERPRHRICRNALCGAEQRRESLWDGNLQQPSGKGSTAKRAVALRVLRRRWSRAVLCGAYPTWVPKAGTLARATRFRGRGAGSGGARPGLAWASSGRAPRRGRRTEAVFGETFFSAGAWAPRGVPDRPPAASICKGVTGPRLRQAKRGRTESGGGRAGGSTVAEVPRAVPGRRLLHRAGRGRDAARRGRA